MAIRIRAHGKSVGFDGRILARITRSEIPDHAERANYALVLGLAQRLHDHDGYAAILMEEGVALGANVPSPVVEQMTTTEHLKNGHVVSIEPRSGLVRTVFRPESPHNTIFATDRCNSNCLMCSQPPKDIAEPGITEQHLRLIDLIENAPDVMGITGGEPTLLGDGLVQILGRLKERFPQTYVHMLTNGRNYKDFSLVERIAAVQHPSFTSAIPLYSDIACIHDYVVQAAGAFDETLEGLYNAAQSGLSIEIRVVLHKQTIPRLPQLAEFIYRNLPFVSHVALMGLEHMGYVKKNWDTLWIDPVDYGDELHQAVRHLWQRRVNVSIYNLPLCLVPKDLWAFCRKSISDFKNIYLDVCAGCAVKDQCSGVFLSWQNRHSKTIQPPT